MGFRQTFEVSHKVGRGEVNMLATSNDISRKTSARYVLIE